MKPASPIVFLVDDDLAVREGLSSLIRSVGLHVEAFASAQDFLAEIQASYDTLTSRERDVIVLIVRGMLNKQAAAELGITEITIKVHRHNIMQKMRARSLPALVRMVERLGLPDLADKRS